MSIELCFKCSKREETCSCLTIFKKQLAIKIAKAKACDDIDKIIKIKQEIQK